MTKESKVLWVRMDPSEYEYLALLAKRNGVSLAEIVRAVVKQQKRVDVHGTAQLAQGIYVPDPETPEGAAEIDQAIDAEPEA